MGKRYCSTWDDGCDDDDYEEDNYDGDGYEPDGWSGGSGMYLPTEDIMDKIRDMARRETQYEERAIEMERLIYESLMEMLEEEILRLED